MHGISYDDYRAGIERLIKLAREQLSRSQQDRIRFAVRNRRDRYETRRLLDDTGAQVLGGQFVAMMRDADSELKPEDVRKLDMLIDGGLERRD